MPTLRRLRWFQFSLATWLLLMAIAGWAFTCRPYWTVSRNWALTGHYDTGAKGLIPVAFNLGPSPPTRATYNKWRRILFDFQIEPKTRVTLNHRLAWPALALAALVLWKVASRLKQWRASRRTRIIASTAPMA